MGNLSIKQCRHGKMMYYPNDVYIGRSLDTYGEYSEAEIAMWKQIIKPEQVVLDVGANIGAHTVWFSKAVGPKGQVVGIEPQRQLYQMMMGNMALNEIRNVFGVNAGIGDRVGMVNVPPVDYGITENFGGVVIGEGTPPGEEVPLVTIDNMALRALHFLKVDVEGMEVNVLRGASKTITAFKPVIYVENDREDKSPELIDELMMLGYRMFWHLSPLFNPTNYTNTPTNIFERIVGVNMLCAHRSLTLNITGLKEVRTRDDKSGVQLTKVAA